jgi:hypothetical protein
VTPEEAAPIHRRLFTDFCRIEMIAGRPDPQVRLTSEAMKLHPSYGPELAGLFVLPYTCAGAAVLWRLVEKKPEPLTWVPWLEQHGQGLPIRKERRPVKGSWDRFTRSADSWLNWCRTEYPLVKNEPYWEVFASIEKNVAYFGRYATMKVCETLFQADLLRCPQDTILPKGAKFPRRVMAKMMPEYAELLNSGKADDQVDMLAARIKDRLSLRLGVQVTWFEVETMLCVYGQSLRGKYPARSHDSELGHWMSMIRHYGEQAALELYGQFSFHRIRYELFNPEYLGEWNDPSWDGVRPDLEAARKAEIGALGIA